MIRDGKLEIVPSQDIAVGEIVYVASGQHFPADFVLLSSSNDDGICYVGTCHFVFTLFGEYLLVCRNCQLGW